MSIPSELDSFREQWLAEVRHRKTLQPKSAVGNEELSDPSQRKNGPKLQSALDYYRLAVDYETKGKLTDALELYRRAFKLDSSVDRLYHHHVAAQGRVAAVVTQELPQHPISEPAFDEKVQPAPISDIVKHLLQFPLVYAPEDEKRPVPITVFPDEVFVRVLAELALGGDHATVERVALVNRKLRLVTLDSYIWRSLVMAVLVPPQIQSEHARLELIKHHKFDFRRIWIEHPRVRLDGVYISLCHYVRHGQSDSPWVSPQYLITYHRYLRFFPDGRVLMLLANGESAPREVVNRLTPNLRLDGVSMGTWAVNGAVVSVSDLTPVASKQTSYSFAMTLVLKARPLGRWSKLDFVEYSSVHLETGDIEPLPMRHERAFNFSKVKRYGLGMEMPAEPDEDVSAVLATVLKGVHL
ncbi:hypothetical protein BKA62DRAFT_612615 [Auriculariales sp. MPI-PUGE-AT-0066]|nr:hypothetical protein BKA62DRAFT_612615 [Auriculariales sp. MPI-PUGE-AT-0066]